MVVDKAFDVTHDLYISLMRRLCHFGDGTGGNDILIPGCGGLGMKDEGNCEKPLPMTSQCKALSNSIISSYLDPFDLS